MPVSVRLNHAIADGYLVAKVFKLLEEEIRGLKEICHGNLPRKNESIDKSG